MDVCAAIKIQVHVVYWMFAYRFWAQTPSTSLQIPYSYFLFPASQILFKLRLVPPKKWRALFDDESEFLFFAQLARQALLKSRNCSGSGSPNARQSSHWTVLPSRHSVLATLPESFRLLQSDHEVQPSLKLVEKFVFPRVKHPSFHNNLKRRLQNAEADIYHAEFEKHWSCSENNNIAARKQELSFREWKAS